MRHRKVKNLDERIDATKGFLVEEATSYKGRWRELFGNDGRLYLELGCGKGGFIAQKAFMHPEKNFIAFDIKSEVLAIAKRNIEAVYGTTHCPNVKITAFDIERIPLVVSPADTIDEIYINFCNPWPKDRHKKRRLTHTRQLNNYKTFLKKNGKIFFKTDDDELFTESLDYFAEAGFEIEFITYDMVENSLPENIVTEHEKMFMDQGIKIKGLIAVNKG